MTEWKSAKTEDDMYTARLPQVYLRRKDCVSIKLGGLFLEIQVNKEKCCLPVIVNVVYCFQKEWYN